MSRDEFERDVLYLGLDAEDVVLHEVIDLAIRKFAVGAPLDLVRERSLAVVRRLVDDGLVRVSEIVPDGSFVDRTEELARLEAEVRDAYDGTPMGRWQDRFWLHNTPAGDEAVADVPDGYDPYAVDRRLEALTTVQRRALVRGVSGPVGLPELAEMIQTDAGASRDAARDEAVATARRFVELGLVTPGVRVGDRFVERPGQLEHLLRDPGSDHVWLRNRRQGDEVAAIFR